VSSSEGAGLSSISKVPQLERAFRAAGQCGATIRRDRNVDPTHDVTLLCIEGADLSSASNVPLLERFVLAAGHRSATVRRESNRIDPTLIRIEGAERLVVLQSPKQVARLQLYPSEVPVR
jgi:hypothetical protein